MESVESFLKHHGVKGMKWGIRKQPLRGGVSVKVGFRPTYTTEEMRAARAAVKSSKKTGGVPVDKDGYALDQVCR